MFFFAKNPDRRVATALKKKRERRPGCAPVASGNPRVPSARIGDHDIFFFLRKTPDSECPAGFPPSLTDIPRL